MKRGQAMTLMPQLLDRGAANPMLMGMALSSWAKSRQTWSPALRNISLSSVV